MACSKERSLHPVEMFGEGWKPEDDGETRDGGDSRGGLDQRPRAHELSAWENATRTNSLGPASPDRRTAERVEVPGFRSASIAMPTSIGEGVSGRGPGTRVRPDAGEKLNERCRIR